VPIARLPRLAVLAAVLAALSPWSLSLEEALAEETSVLIRDQDMQPAVLTVQAGATVTWFNQGSQPHTTTSDDRIWDSRNIPVTKLFQFQFNQPGRYLYHCSIHPRIRGEVVVEGTAVSPPPAAVLPSRPAGPEAPSAPTSTPQPTPTPTPIPKVLLHLAAARYAAQPLTKLQEASQQVTPLSLVLLPAPNTTQVAAGALTLVVPPGAIRHRSDLLVAPVPFLALTPPPGYRYVADVYAIASAGGSTLVLAKPVQLRFSYSIEALGGIPERSLSLAAWDTNPGRWTLLHSTVDPKRRVVLSRAERLTVLALVAKP